MTTLDDEKAAMLELIECQMQCESDGGAMALQHPEATLPVTVEEFQQRWLLWKKIYDIINDKVVAAFPEPVKISSCVGVEHMSDYPIKEER